MAQDGVPHEEAAAAVAAESSTGTWTTVWPDLLTDLDYYKGRAYRIEPVPGDNTAYYAFVAYPIDLFEEGSVVNVLTSLVGNVFVLKLYVVCDWKIFVFRLPMLRLAAARQMAYRWNVIV